MFTNEEKVYLLKYAAQRWGITYDAAMKATAEEMTKTAAAGMTPEQALEAALGQVRGAAEGANNNVSEAMASRTPGAWENYGNTGGSPGASPRPLGFDPGMGLGPVIERMTSGYPSEVPPASGLAGLDLGIPTPGGLSDEQRSTLGVSGLGAAFGAGGLALTRMMKARQAAEAAARAGAAAKGMGALGKLRALLG